MQFERIVERGAYRIDLIDGPGPDLAIAFSSVGHDPARPPAPEFVATATRRGSGRPGRRALFVSDAGRSWANDPDFEPALRAALDQAGRRAPLGRIATLGLSMGAFSALAAARVLPVDAVLAFSPQWSVSVPGETRWAEWTARLPPLRWPTAPQPMRAQSYLFHGAADDLPHALRFPAWPRSDQLLFAGLGHSGLVPHLKSRGALAGLLEAALSGDRRRVLRIAASAGAKRRLPPPSVWQQF